MTVPALAVRNATRVDDTCVRRQVPAELLAPSTDQQLLRMAAEEWLMIAAVSAGVALLPAWTYPVTLLLLAGRYHALGVILHDASHTRSRQGAASRLLLEALCGLPIGTTLPAMRYHHRRHHRESGGHFDPYHKEGNQTWAWWVANTVRGVLLYPFWTVRPFVGVVAAIVPGTRTTYARLFLQDRSGKSLRESREVIACARAESRQLLFQVVVLMLYVQWPVSMITTHLLPVLMAGLLSARRLLIEHRFDHDADHSVDGVVSSTRDNHLGWLGAIAFAPRNVGYHVVHHLHPRASLAHLPRLRQWYRQNYPNLYH